MIRKAGAVATIALGLLCLVNLHPDWLFAQQFETTASIANKLKNASSAQINPITEKATNLGNAITVVTTAAADTEISMSSPANMLPINYRSIWSDFGGGNTTDSHGWNYNARGEDPDHWGAAMVLETPFSGVMEYWWSMQAPTASAFDTWRSMIFSVNQATSFAELNWAFDKMRWFSNTNINANPDEQFTIDTENEQVFTTGVPFGVGTTPRALGGNGPMFRVTGSSGTGLEFVTFNPTTLANNATVLYINPPSGNAANQGYEVVSSNSDTIGNTLRNTHATGVARYTIWAVGGDAATRWLTTNGDWAAGVDNSDGGAFKVAASFDLPTSTALRVDKTSLNATFSGSVLAKTLVEANTAGSGAPNVIVAAESRTTYTNEGSTAQNYHTLPAAAAGIRLRFIVQDADGIRIVAAGDDTIRNAATASAAAGFIQSSTIGNVIELEAINATEWFVTSIIGTWTIDS